MPNGSFSNERIRSRREGINCRFFYRSRSGRGGSVLRPTAFHVHPATARLERPAAGPSRHDLLAEPVRRSDESDDRPADRPSDVERAHVHDGHTVLTGDGVAPGRAAHRLQPTAAGRLGGTESRAARLVLQLRLVRPPRNAVPTAHVRRDNQTVARLKAREPSLS